MTVHSTVASGSVLEVRGLSVEYGLAPRSVPALRGVDLTLGRGEVLGIAGESGSGKSTFAYAISRLLRPPGVITAGSVRYLPRHDAEVDVLGMSDRQLRSWRWEKLAHVSQAAMNALNPVATVAAQLTDTLAAHRPKMSARERLARAGELLDLVDIPTGRLQAYPHQLSGGMRQRVLIAMALALDPEIVVMDEPTTALDVVVQREILIRLEDLRSQLGFAVIFITHDMSLLLEIADSIAVMYAGKIVEVAPANDIRLSPQHPYTRGLLTSFPALTGPRKRLIPLAGTPPRLTGLPTGCAFHPRCPIARDECREVIPALLPHGEARVACLALEPERGPWPMEIHRGAVDDLPEPSEGDAAQPTPILEVRDLSKRFAIRGTASDGRRAGRRRRTILQAVDRVSIALAPGRALALVGESGSGKSTVARILAGLETPTSGEIALDGRSLREHRISRRRYHALVQMVFQDPFSSLNPLHTVRYHLARALRNFPTTDRRPLDDRLVELLETVQLTPADRYLARHPHELSGGERQRVAIARALAPGSTVLLADEPVSMLDVSIRLGILNLLRELNRTRDLAMLYITHDIASARHFADEVAVMFRGEIVEGGPAELVVGGAAHPYTQLLIASSPDPDRDEGKLYRPAAVSGTGSPAPSAGCPFASRCPHAMQVCVTEKPGRTEMGGGHWVRCFRYGNEPKDDGEPAADGARSPNSATEGVRPARPDAVVPPAHRTAS